MSSPAPWSFHLAAVRDDSAESKHRVRSAIEVLMNSLPVLPDEVYWVHVQIGPPPDDEEDNGSDPGVERFAPFECTWTPPVNPLHKEVRQDLRDAQRELNETVTVGADELLIRAGPLGDECLSSECAPAKQLNTSLADADTQYARIGHPQHDLFFHARAAEDICVWVACKNWTSVRGSLLFPLRALLTELVGVLLFSATRRLRTEVKSAQHDLGRMKGTYEAAEKLLDLLDTAGPHIRVLSRSRRNHWSCIDERYYLPPDDPNLLPVAKKPLPMGDGYEFRHEWEDPPTEPLRTSLRWQVAAILSWFFRVDLVLTGPEYHLEQLRTNETFRGDIGKVFGPVHRSFSRILQEPNDISAFLKVFEILKACFHDSFDEDKKNLRYALWALWASEMEISTEQIAKLEPVYCNGSGLPAEVLQALEGLSWETRPRYLNTDLRMSYGDPQRAELRVGFILSEAWVSAAEHYWEDRPLSPDRRRHSLESPIELLKGYREFGPVRLSRPKPNELQVILGQ
jgi:hypothetical protein